MLNILSKGFTAQCAAILLTSAVSGTAFAVIRHDIRIVIEPDRGEIRVKDRLALPADLDRLCLGGAARLSSVRGARVQAASGDHCLWPDAGSQGTVELEYALPMAAAVDERAPPGSGVHLDAASNWIAAARDRRHSFSLEVRLPAAWTAVSQGERSLNELQEGQRVVRWLEPQPQQEIYLIAGAFTEYESRAGDVVAMAFLRRPDPKLADRYLSVTGDYIALFEDMLGPYPYAKFALVENAWDSGFGMPSFTLLGPRVIRLPFIVHTSYPHEILHNWWGNSVYIDYDSGNWGEGLTSYLADHWLQRQRGKGAQYRRDALQKYLSFVSAERDFPLTAFRSRHGESTQAVGYHKTMMMFHMLWQRLGDEVFFAGLQRFYRQFRFRVAAFADLETVFQEVSGDPVGISRFFEQWVERTGAPELVLDAVGRERTAHGYRLRGRLRQVQAGEPYSLTVPVRVETGQGARDHPVLLEDREQGFELDLEHAPQALLVDPDFDLFRKLHPDEVPPALGAVYGAELLHFVLPRQAGAEEIATLQAFAAAWRGPERSVRVLYDDQALPEAGALWLLGWRNAARGLLQDSLAATGPEFTGDAVRMAGETLSAATHSLVLAGRTGSGRPLAWTHLAGGDPAALARRLRHYSRFSYVALREGRAVARGQWPVLDSPLTVRFAP